MSGVAAMLETLPDESAGGERVEFRQVGTAGGITGHVILNAVLNILTLSLWRFWGRTRVRRYLWSTTLINGDPLEYTGTGWELCRAFLLVVFGLGLPFALLILAGELLLPPPVFVAIVAVAYIPAVLFVAWLTGVAVWLSRRYRMSRTRWRGIRFGMKGSFNTYAWASIGYGILTSITLGWFAPVAAMRLHRRLWRETVFGDRQIRITVEDEELTRGLYGPFALGWLGSIAAYVVLTPAMVFLSIGLGFALGETDPTAPASVGAMLAVYLGLIAVALVIGLVWMPYLSALMRRQAEVVGFEGLTFRLNAKPMSLLWLHVGNLLIIVFTLGFGTPYAELRTARYIVNRLESRGAVDAAAIRQNPDKGPKSGEGLADFLDVGGAF